jgi:hypothetical protein
MIEQVYHTNCSDKKAPLSYWRDIQFVANLIGCRFQNTHDSTIEVFTSKEKFGEVRVYCQLAEDKKVLKKFIDKQKNDLSVVDMYDSQFSRSCIISDAVLYRETYRNLVALMPQYEKAIMQSADYRYLLLDSFEDFIKLFDDDQKLQELVSDDFSITDKQDLLNVIKSIYAQ